MNNFVFVYMIGYFFRFHTAKLERCLPIVVLCTAKTAFLSAEMKYRGAEMKGMEMVFFASSGFYLVIWWIYWGNCT